MANRKSNRRDLEAPQKLSDDDGLHSDIADISSTCARGHSNRHRLTRISFVLIVLTLFLLFVQLTSSAYLSSPRLASLLDWVHSVSQRLEPLRHKHQLSKHPFSSLKGPHIRQNFPDPCVLNHNGTLYAFATNNRMPGPDLIRVQIAVSKDNKTWTVLPDADALPSHAQWETGQRVWAPDVKELPNGRFLLYYTDSLKSDPSTHCIGAAISDKVKGPYDPLSHPLICPHGGAIDPAGFLDRSTGKRYIVYKVDGNSLGRGGLCNNGFPPIRSTPLMLQEVNPYDGITLLGKPLKLLDRDIKDGPLIEAPAIYLSSEGIYFLFYSANCFTTPSYHISYATATNITGPYVRASRPLLMSGDGLDTEGPGGMDILHHSYAAVDEGIEKKKKKKRKKKHGYDEEGRLIVFHGRMNSHNNPQAHKDQACDDQHVQGPIRKPQQGFVRGMYSGTAFFKGRTISLRKHGFKK